METITQTQERESNTLLTKEEASPLDQNIEITKLVSKYRDPALDGNDSIAIDLSEDFHLIYKKLKHAKAEPVEIASTLFKWFKANKKSEFFFDDECNYYLFVSGKLVTVGSDEFEALILSVAGISSVTQMGRIVEDTFEKSAIIEGKKMTRENWLHTDRKNHTVYLSLKSEKDELLRITPDEITLVPNGNNSDHVFMVNLPEDKLQATEYIELDEKQLEEALRLVNDLVVTHIPASNADKWMAFAWRMSYPLFDFTTAHLITRFQGGSTQGKTTACRLLCLSLYGEDYVDKSTVAGFYSDASINPLVIEDNLESNAFFSDQKKVDFYLAAATGGSKQKRNTKTKSGLIREKIRSLVMCNGIESIAKSELSSRMMVIDCEKDSYPSNYNVGVLLEIEQKRNEIFSAECLITQKVLQRIKNGEWIEILNKLEDQFPNHPKARMFDHLAIMILYLEEVYKIIYRNYGTWNLVAEWMDYQQKSAYEEIRNTDPIVRSLDILKDIALQKFQRTGPTYTDGTYDPLTIKDLINVEADGLEIELNEDTIICRGLAGPLHTLLSSVYRSRLKQSFPLKNPQVMANRLKNILSQLNANGCEVQITEASHEKQKEYQFSWDV
jgi:hypothetical protein